MFRRRNMTSDNNALRYALLGLLSRRSLSGWELLKRFRRSVVFFWHAERSQVYAELKRMERLGLVRSRLTVQDTRPNTRHYALTPAGRAALRAWLDRPTAAAPVKDRMLLRTFFADQVPATRAVQYLRRHGDEHRRVLAEFEAIRAALEAQYGGLEETEDPALAFGALVLEHGIRFERMYAEWCAWAADAVARRRRPGRTRAPADAGDFIMTR